MNRSLTNVLFGGIASPVSSDAHKIEGTINKTTVDDTVDALTNADSVILVKRKDFCVFTQNRPIFSLRSLDMVWPLPRLSMPFQKSQQCYDPKVSMSECVRVSKDYRKISLICMNQVRHPSSCRSHARTVQCSSGRSIGAL
jgi:hypothetical protein